MNLKPCPHCGEEKDLEKHFVNDREDEFNFLRVRCMNCGALGPDASTWLKAQECWNERKNTK